MATGHNPPRPVVILYPAGGGFNKLRSAQPPYLKELLTKHMQGYHQAEDKCYFVKENILSQITVLLWEGTPDNGRTVTPSPDVAYKRIIQRFRDFRKAVRNKAAKEQQNNDNSPKKRTPTRKSAVKPSTPTGKRSTSTTGKPLTPPITKSPTPTTGKRLTASKPAATQQSPRGQRSSPKPASKPVVAQSPREKRSRGKTGATLQRLGTSPKRPKPPSTPSPRTRISVRSPRVAKKSTKLTPKPSPLLPVLPTRQPSRALRPCSEHYKNPIATAVPLPQRLPSRALSPEHYDDPWVVSLQADVICLRELCQQQQEQLERQGRQIRFLENVVDFYEQEGEQSMSEDDGGDEDDE